MPFSSWPFRNGGSKSPSGRAIFSATSTPCCPSRKTDSGSPTTIFGAILHDGTRTRKNISSQGFFTGIRIIMPMTECMSDGSKRSQKPQTKKLCHWRDRRKSLALIQPGTVIRHFTDSVNYPILDIVRSASTPDRYKRVVERRSL